MEDKSYPRDTWQRGRVRVTIKKEDGTPIAKEFPTRKAVMVEIARQGRHSTPPPPLYSAPLFAMPVTPHPVTAR